MNPITVFFFANLRDRTGMRSAHIEIPAEATVANLRTILSEKFISLQGVVDGSLVAINHEYAADNSPIPAGAEVALFPAVSGG
ncbi:MAG: molybdopterin converting factor subunit 1 [Chloroflexota bacterium]